jgi:hypothetical protein
MQWDRWDAFSMGLETELSSRMLVFRGRSPQFQARLKKVLKCIRARDADLVRLLGNGSQALQRAIVGPE